MKMQALLGDDDSDEDTFYDRTGRAEKKQQQSTAAKAKKEQPAVETYDTLQAKKELLEAEMATLHATIEGMTAEIERQQKVQGDEDDLDSYMQGLTATKATPEAKYKLDKKYQDMQKVQI